MSSDYDIQDIKSALNTLNIQKGDTLFCHSNIGLFGRLKGGYSRDELCRNFFNLILDKIGSSGTLILPSFTYSFPKNEIFDPACTPSKMGLFSEWLRKHPDSLRSKDPCFSVVSIGDNSKFLTSLAPENSFGVNSFFDRFYDLNGKIFNLNFNAGSTFIHYVERKLKVPYRFDKTFKGRIRLNSQFEQEVNSTIWVRYLSDQNLEYDSKQFTEISIKNNLFTLSKIGRGYAGVISSKDTFNVISETIKVKPFFLTKGGAIPFFKPLIIAENQSHKNKKI